VDAIEGGAVLNRAISTTRRKLPKLAEIKHSSGFIRRRPIWFPFSFRPAEWNPIRANYPAVACSPLRAKHVTQDSLHFSMASRAKFTSASEKGRARCDFYERARRFYSRDNRACACARWKSNDIHKSATVRFTAECTSRPRITCD